MTSSHDVTTGSRQRALWVDTLRVVVIAGVIVLHAATGYVVDIAGWYYDDERSASGAASAVLTVPGLLGALFWLGPLFLVAGWFSARSLERRGPGRFARNRLVRLGVPLLVFVLVLQPATDVMGNVWDERGSFSFYLRHTEVGSMWFVAAVLVFSLAYAVLRHVRPVPGPPRRSPTAVVLLTMAAIAAGSLLVWQLWPLTDDMFLNLKVSEWPQGAGLFAIGVHAAEVGWVDQPLHPRARLLGWIALGAAFAFVALVAVGVSAGEEDLGPGTGWPMVATALLNGLIAVAWTVWFLDWSRRRWPGHGALVGKAARGSYAAYVIHPVVVTSMMLAFASVGVGVWAKWVLVAALAVPACFVTGYGLTRVPGVAKVL
jgi:glucan biosynthesis protein C